MLPLETRDLAQRLLASEASAGNSSHSTESAALRVYEKLRRNLCALAGVAGFRALAARALTLAKAEVPGLSVMQIMADGSMQGLDEMEPPGDKHPDGNGEVILIAELLGLLMIFIGRSMTLRLVQDAWPEADLENCNSGDGTRA
jgi:hypothetical protein